MTFVITQPCVDVQDQSCVEVCPVDCIHFEAGADRMLYIEPEVCIDCGACEPACPVNAIFAEADLPGDQAHFLEINALWFSDRAAARAQVGGDAPAEEAPSAAPQAAGDGDPPAAAGGGAPADAAPAAGDAAAPAAAEAEAGAAAAPAAAGAQVEAVEEGHGGGPILPHHRQPSPVSVIALAGLLLSLAAVWLAPGPRLNGGTPAVGWLAGAWPQWSIWRNLEGPSEIGLLALLPAALCLVLFAWKQAGVLRVFDAARERPIAGWREAGVAWRRSEESRRHELETAVGQIARDRFPFPDEAHPAYRTYVNVPEPQLALEFTAGGASRAQVFPDIVVVEHPRNRPIMVAQIETRETVTRRQAELVWAQLESADAPLYLYVPSGLADRARDYALAAGIGRARIRTWRRQPGGMLVREV